MFPRYYFGIGYISSSILCLKTLPVKPKFLVLYFKYLINVFSKNICTENVYKTCFCKYYSVNVYLKTFSKLKDRVFKPFCKHLLDSFMVSLTMTSRQKRHHQAINSAKEALPRGSCGRSPKVPSLIFFFGLMQLILVHVMEIHFGQHLPKGICFQYKPGITE